MNAHVGKLLLPFLILGCAAAPGEKNNAGKLPPDCRHISYDKGSFGYFLQQFPLKPQGKSLQYYDGSLVGDQEHFQAILDFPLSRRDLVQCADAVIGLRSRYLRSSGQTDRIRFHLTNGMEVPYSRWINGERVWVKGNETGWQNGGAKGDTDNNFLQYLDFIYSYAGTLSLSREVPKINPDSLQAGDIFLQGGSPGHTMMVVDMAVDTVSGKKYFKLAQGLMPSMEVHIVTNPGRPDISPWYELKEGEKLQTPNWEFHWDELFRFSN